MVRKVARRRKHLFNCINARHQEGRVCNYYFESKLVRYLLLSLLYLLFGKEWSISNFHARQKQYGTHRNRVRYVGTKTVIFTPEGRGYCLYNGLQGEASSEKDAFFRLQLYENVGILLVEEYKRKTQISGNF